MKSREIIYILLLFISAVALHNGYKAVNEYKAITMATTDTLVKTRNELGQEKAATALLYGSIKDLKAMRVADTSAIGKLQKMVNQLTLSATYLRTSTRNNFTSATVYLSGDTVTKDSLIYVYPRYHTDSSSRWSSYSITATRDSFQIDFTTYNEFEIKQEWKKHGLFKRKTLEASVVNLNPNTTTLQFQTFTIKENRSNRVRDFLYGALAGSILTKGALFYFRTK